MNRLLVLVASSSLAFSSCGDPAPLDERSTGGALTSSSEIDSQDEAATAEPVEEIPQPVQVDLPELDDSQRYVNAQEPVPIPEILGLTEEQAREWALASGWSLFVNSGLNNDLELEAYLSPSRRLIYALDSDGRVDFAEAG